MLAKELISDVVPSLKTSDTGVKALSYMEVFRISHLPIVNHFEFLGLISDKDIYDLNMAEESIGNHTLSLTRPFVLEKQHIYDAIDLASRLELSLIPVLDDKNNYLGVITLNDLTKTFANLMSIKNPGGIIVLDLNSNDYSLTHISQIIEGNDAKILSLYVGSNTDSTKLDLTIKINRTDLSGILQTFNRFNYNVKASYNETDTLTELYEDRMELFLRYLDV